MKLLKLVMKSNILIGPSMFRRIIMNLGPLHLKDWENMLDQVLKINEGNPDMFRFLVLFVDYLDQNLTESFEIKPSPLPKLEDF